MVENPINHINVLIKFIYAFEIYFCIQCVTEWVCVCNYHHVSGPNNEHTPFLFGSEFLLLVANEQCVECYCNGSINKSRSRPMECKQIVIMYIYIWSTLSNDNNYSWWCFCDILRHRIAFKNIYISYSQYKFKSC